MEMHELRLSLSPHLHRDTLHKGMNDFFKKERKIDLQIIYKSISA